jgi:hypothetical protein
MLCAVASSPTRPVTHQCRKCGLVLSGDRFSPDPDAPGGLDSWCRDCRNAVERSRRAVERAGRTPTVLGTSEPEPLLTAVLGALRLHYDGRPARLLTDLRATLRDLDPADRVNAMLTLLALREIGVALKSRPMTGDMLELALDSLPDAEWQRLAERQAKRRAPPV